MLFYQTKKQPKKSSIMKQNNYFENEKRINIDFKFSAEIEAKIIHWNKENIFFGVFPIKGESMTCTDLSKSIPNESKVLVYDLELNFNNGLSNIWHDIPKNEPLLIIGKTDAGHDFLYCKTISSIDVVNGNVLLSSYNPTHQSKWFPFHWIKNIFKVVQIV